MADGRYFKKLKIALSLQWLKLQAIATKFGRKTQSSALNPFTNEILKFRLKTNKAIGCDFELNIRL